LIAGDNDRIVLSAKEEHGMRDVPELVNGYRRFGSSLHPRALESYRSLAKVGQKPKTMVIACCDSRVDPAAIFDAGPGELFVVRNVANLVPPFESHGDHHCTGAALEFAVTGLEVETIVVLGHARCGGVRAVLEGHNEKSANRGFVDRWMSALNATRAEVLRDIAQKPIESQQQALEHASVRYSLQNLETFPFIKERVASGRLRLRGAYFDIADGSLMALDSESNSFGHIEVWRDAAHIAPSRGNAENPNRRAA